MWMRMVAMLTVFFVLLFVPATAVGCAPSDRPSSFVPIEIKPIGERSALNETRVAPRSTQVTPVPIPDRSHWDEVTPGIFSVRVGAESCEEARMELPESAPEDGELWQMCYDVPPWGMDGRDNGDWDEGLPRGAPSAVAFTVRRGPTLPSVVLALVQAPPDEGRWSASVLVRLVEERTDPILLNAVNIYRNGTAFVYRPAIGTDLRMHHVVTTGRLQLWSVLRDGSRERRSHRLLAHGCVDPLSPEFGLEHGVSALPDISPCPVELQECGDGPYHCSAEH